MYRKARSRNRSHTRVTATKCKLPCQLQGIWATHVERGTQKELRARDRTQTRTGLQARTSSDMQSPLIARKSHYGQDQSPCKDQSKVAMQMDYIRSTHQVPKDTTMMTLESAVSSSQAQHTGTGMSLSEQSP